MKKIFALALAAVMTAGMTTVAFAAPDAVTFVTGGQRRYGVEDDGVYSWKGETSANEMAKDDFSGEDEVALFLFGADGKPVTDKDALDRYKVSADWTVGKVEAKPEIKMVKTATMGYVYAVTFTLPEAPETKEADLAGTVTVYKSTEGKKEDVAKFEVGLSYGFDANDYVVTGDDDLTKEDAVKFNYDDVAVLTFGSDLEFEVDLTGQGKLNVKNNRDFNKEFAGMYDYANIDFINFEYAPSFNKTGVAYIYADEDAFIYEVTADGAKEINGLKWDEDYEAWTFKTRTLGSYAISDVELTEKTETEDKDDTTPDGGKENPDTGR